jgi:hypothetical protein
LEEWLLKDNENIPFFDDEQLVPSEPQGFAPDQMVRCEECLRANPPTRLSCLYCAAPLPLSEKATDLIKPSLKPVQTWTVGYNNIFLSHDKEISDEVLSKVAGFLKLNPNDLTRLLSSTTPLPLARTGTREEAELIDRRLKVLGFETVIVSDKDLELRESPPIRLRSVSINESGLTPQLIVGSDETQIPWNQLVLIVTGRLSRKRVELQERKRGRGDNEITDASQFFADELVLDLYGEGPDSKFRILANGFDFSGLQGKGLLVAENFSKLIDLIREQVPQVEHDDSYNSCRQALETVWPAGQQTESMGWRREGPGKYTTGAATESSNEDQFTRYSRLRYFLKTKAARRDYDEDYA